MKINKNILHQHQLGTTDIANNICIIIELGYCDRDRCEGSRVFSKKNLNHYRKQSVTLNFSGGFF